MRLAAFGSGAAVGVLGGLIGLGGAEFRLPILMGVFRLSPHRAVPLNLLISLATLAASAAFRTQLLPETSLALFAFEIVSLTVGAIVAAWFGAGILRNLPVKTLTILIACMLLAIAGILLLDALVLHDRIMALPNHGVVRVLAGLALGLVIGLVSSLLGVAGGELIIPTLVVIFGVDVHTAGTASLFISMPAVSVGVLYHLRSGSISRTDARVVAVPMALGSIIGAYLGAYAAQYMSAQLLKVALAGILAVSSAKIILPRRARPIAKRA
jgi:uncharacterized protein